MSVELGGKGSWFGWKGREKRSRSKSPGKGKSVSRYITRRELPRVIMRAINKRAENKHWVHEFASALADENGAVYHLSNIDDGVGSTERVGRNIMVTGFDLAGFFNSDHTAESVLCRIMIVRCNERITSTPAITDVLRSSATVRTPTQLYNVDNVQVGVPGANNSLAKFSIYYDKLVGMSDEGSSLTKVPFKTAIRLPTPMPCEYTGPEDTDEGAGQWYLIYCSSQPTGNTTCQLNADCRIYYTDA